MNDELETSIETQDGVTVSVSEWDDGGAWISMVTRHSSFCTSLTRSEAYQMLTGLQAILTKGAA